jgi:HSP20 family protein
MTTNPFIEFRRLLEQMQENIEDVAHGLEGDSPGHRSALTSAISVDIEDREEAFVVTAELPGFEKDDIDVRLADQRLHIEAEHREESDQTDGEYIRRERRHTSVARSVRLPEAVETADIEATYNNGILTVHLPKSEPAATGTQIDVQ